MFLLKLDLEVDLDIIFVGVWIKLDTQLLFFLVCSHLIKHHSLFEFGSIIQTFHAIQYAIF
jgi:hypothetical protein